MRPVDTDGGLHVAGESTASDDGPELIPDAGNRVEFRVVELEVGCRVPVL